MERMKKALEFTIEDWLGPWDGDPASAATLASLRVLGRDGTSEIPITEVYDAAARTVRQHVNLSAYSLAEWLLINWWRLRWEPVRQTFDWQLAHSLAAIGGGFAWPPLSVSSDGDFIQVRQVSERRSDMASIRYLNDVALEIPARDFEAAVDEFVEQVIGRLAACDLRDSDLTAIRDELAQERANPEVALACSLQARAGLDPGEAPDGWLAEIHALGAQTGTGALGELAAALPELGGGIETARRGIEEIRQSGSPVDLSWLHAPDYRSHGELPWQQGARLAVQVRAQIGQSSGPISDDLLSDCFKISFPLSDNGHWILGGGLRGDGAGNQAKIAVPRSRPESQRFYLARIAASALLSSSEDSYLAVTDTGTAMQKAERSFAQEFLCPWRDLDAFADEHGLEDRDIAGAAEQFHVSEWMVLSTLVNHGKLSRDRLPLALR